MSALSTSLGASPPNDRSPFSIEPPVPPKLNVTPFIDSSSLLPVSKACALVNRVFSIAFCSGLDGSLPGLAALACVKRPRSAKVWTTGMI